MKKFHIAISVTDIGKSIADYSQRLNCQPQIIIKDEYALWRTDLLNFSIHKAEDEVGVDHLGWEDSTVSQFTDDIDTNGIMWQRFNSDNQLEEMRKIWPE